MKTNNSMKMWKTIKKRQFTKVKLKRQSTDKKYAPSYNKRRSIFHLTDKNVYN